METGGLKNKTAVARVGEGAPAWEPPRCLNDGSLLRLLGKCGPQPQVPLLPLAWGGGGSLCVGIIVLQSAFQ